MNNQRFEDIAILKTLAELRSKGLLHPKDQETLRSQLLSDWGRKAAADMLSDNVSEFAKAKSVIRYFSDVV